MLDGALTFCRRKGCTSTRRLFLQSSIAPSFLASLTSAYTSTLSRIGDPLLHSTLIGPLHNADGVAKFEQAIKEIEAQGGKILIGGKVRKMEAGSGFEGGNWVEPTIAVFEDSRKAEVMRRETFAPSQSRSSPSLVDALGWSDADDSRAQSCSFRLSRRWRKLSSSTTLSIKVSPRRSSLGTSDSRVLIC